MAYQAMDYSSLEEELEKNPPKLGGFTNRLTFPTKNKDGVAFKAGKHYDNIVLRILPAGKGKDVTNEKPWRERVEHWADANKTYVPCKMHEGGVECEYCNMKKVHKRTTFCVNVLILANPFDEASVGEVKEFAMNKTLFRELYSSVRPDEEGAKPRHPFDLVKGNDFKLGGTLELKFDGKPIINWSGSRFEKTTRIAFLKENDDGDFERVPLSDEEIGEVLEKRQDLWADGKQAPAKEKKPVSNFDADDDDDELPAKKEKKVKKNSDFFDD